MKKITLVVFRFFGIKNYSIQKLKFSFSQILVLIFSLLLITLRVIYTYKIHDMILNCKDIISVFVSISNDIDIIISLFYISVLFLESISNCFQIPKTGLITKLIKSFPNFVIALFVLLSVFAYYKTNNFNIANTMYIVSMDFLLHHTIHFTTLLKSKILTFRKKYKN